MKRALRGRNIKLIHEKLSCKDAATFWRGCNKQCFTLYCCLSRPKFPPLFPWSSNTTCCNLIIYILSLVHQRRMREQRRATIHPSNSREPQLSLGTVAETREMTVGVHRNSLVNDDEELNASGGGKQWTLQHPQAPRNSVRLDVAVDHSQYTHFGRFFTTFGIFQPLWCHTKAPEEPDLLVKVPLKFQERHEELYGSGRASSNIEIWLHRETSPFWTRQLHDFWNDVRIPHSRLRATFEI